jgi:hypothetical protein
VLFRSRRIVPTKSGTTRDDESQCSSAHLSDLNTSYFLCKSQVQSSIYMTASEYIQEQNDRIRDFLACEELSYDPMYQRSMDTAWHYWMQEKYDKQRKEWEKRYDLDKFNH